MMDAPTLIDPTRPPQRPVARRHAWMACASLLVGLAAAPALAQDGSAEPSHPNLKVWNWTNVDPSYSSKAWPESANPSFAGGDWVSDGMYSEGAVSISDLHPREPGAKSIRFYLNPNAPVPEKAPFPGEHRAEIRRYKWHEPVPMGTEEWHAWSYYFPETYVHDRAARGVYMQLHAGRSGPPVGIDQWSIKDHNGKFGGQIYINRRWGKYAGGPQHRETLPFEFEPGKWYDFVVHVIWDTEEGGQGLTELWVNGNKYYSAKGGNTYSAGTDAGDPNLPYGGTLKLGFYKWPWRDPAVAKESQAAGVKELEMFLGPVRTVRLAPGEHIGEAGYDLVAPRTPIPDGMDPKLPPSPQE